MNQNRTWNSRQHFSNCGRKHYSVCICFALCFVSFSCSVFPSSQRGQLLILWWHANRTELTAREGAVAGKAWNIFSPKIFAMVFLRVPVLALFCFWVISMNFRFLWRKVTWRCRPTILAFLNLPQARASPGVWLGWTCPPQLSRSWCRKEKSCDNMRERGGGCGVKYDKIM